MADSILVFPPAFRVLDQEGNPVSGAKIRFWEGGTSTPKNVHSDPNLSSVIGTTVYTRSDGYPVASQGSDTTVAVWIGAGLYDVDVVDENDVTIYPRKINQKGALDTSDFLTSDSTSTLVIPVNAVSASGDLDADSRGKFLNVNTSGANVALTLDEAVTLGDNWNVELRKAHASNALIIQVSGSDVLHFNGQQHTSIALSQLGEGVSLRCDGTAFYVASYTPPLRNAVGVIVIADRITSAPVSPTPGARYLVTSSFSTFETHDIIEADAAGGFIEYTPTTDCGWIAYVQDEDAFYVFVGTAWVASAIHVAGLSEDSNPSGDDDFVGTYDASAAGHAKVRIGRLPGSVIAILEDNKAQNTVAQTLTSNADNVRVLNTAVYNRGSLVTLSSNQFTLPAGTWEIEWYAPVGSADGGESAVAHQSWLYNVTDAAEVKRGVPGRVDTVDNTATVTQPSLGSTVVTITASKAFEIRHRPVGDDLLGGERANLGAEVYARVVIRRA